MVVYLGWWKDKPTEKEGCWEKHWVLHLVPHLEKHLAGHWVLH